MSPAALPTSSSGSRNLRQAALLSLLLLGGAAAAAALASYLSKSPRAALSAMNDGASVDEWLHRVAATLHQTRQRMVENLDQRSGFNS